MAFLMVTGGWLLMNLSWDSFRMLESLEGKLSEKNVYFFFFHSSELTLGLGVYLVAFFCLFKLNLWRGSVSQKVSGRWR